MSSPGGQGSLWSLGGCPSSFGDPNLPNGHLTLGEHGRFPEALFTVGWGTGHPGELHLPPPSGSHLFTRGPGSLQLPGRLGITDRVPRDTDEDRKVRLACSLGATLHTGRSLSLKQRPSARGWLVMAWALCMPPPGPLTSHRNQGAGPGPWHVS